jgi:hypothetical protein
MNGLLAVAAAFLERMTNPQYGPDVNEEYSFRLHEALAEDSDLSLVISLVPEISPGLEVVEDLLLFTGDDGRERLGSTVDVNSR